MLNFALGDDEGLAFVILIRGRFPVEQLEGRPRPGVGEDFLDRLAGEHHLLLAVLALPQRELLGPLPGGPPPFLQHLVDAEHRRRGGEDAAADLDQLVEGVGIHAANPFN